MFSKIDQMKIAILKQPYQTFSASSIVWLRSIDWMVIQLIIMVPGTFLFECLIFWELKKKIIWLNWFQDWEKFLFGEIFQNLIAGHSTLIITTWLTGKILNWLLQSVSNLFHIPENQTFIKRWGWNTDHGRDRRCLQRHPGWISKLWRLRERCWQIHGWSKKDPSLNMLTKGDCHDDQSWSTF